jgi:hypothetical protein
MVFLGPYVTPVTQAGFGGVRIQKREGQVHEPPEGVVSPGEQHGTGRSDRREKRQRGDEHGGRVNTVGGACLAAAERATGVPEATVLHDS